MYIIYTVREVQISIHALREEGDNGFKDPVLPRILISIHALREEGDCQNSQQHSGAAAYFYPRPPRGGRLANLGEQPVKKKISIHALREEGDVGIHGVSSTSPIFLSTPSSRRATSSRSSC